MKRVAESARSVCVTDVSEF